MINMYEMHELDETEAVKPRKVGPLLIVIICFTVIGSVFGIMIADQDLRSALKTETSGLISASFGSLFADLKAIITRVEDQRAAESQLETAFEVISTGLPSVGTIRYSPKANSTQMIFDLVDMKLIQTGRLTDPHRVYVDLQDIYWEPDSFKGIKTLKALDINGDLVSRVRIKKRESGVMRIVLDLKQSCDMTCQIPQNSPSRLIVQLLPV